MQIVRGHTTIKFLKQGDSFSARLFSTKSLVQFVDNGNNTVTPDWTQEANQPVVYPVIISQLLGTYVSEITDVHWYLDNTELSFTGDATSDGAFRKTSYSTSDMELPALQICSNIMLSASQNRMLKFSGTISSGGITTQISCDIPIARSEVSGDVYLAEISVTNNGVIDSSVTEIKATAILRKGGSEITSGVTYAWYYSTPDDTDEVQDGWQPMNRTTKEISITEDMIPSRLFIKVDCTVSGNVVASGFVTVDDIRDPFYIVNNPSLLDEMLSYQQPSITYTPKVRRRGSTTDETGWKFDFSVSDVKGVVKKTAQDASTITVTYQEMITFGGGDLNLDIEAHQ